MNLFFINEGDLQESGFRLTGQEARHASKVLRMRVGDEIRATDGNGHHFIGSVIRIERDSLYAEIRNQNYEDLPRPEIILGIGFIKKRDRLEFAIEKAVEVGAHRIALINTRYAEKAPFKKDRLEMITKSAMKQSLRFHLPKLEVFSSFEECLDHYRAAEIIMAHQIADKATDPITNTKDQILLLVGPEGGFSDEEVNTAVEANATMVSLGPKRLRAETAAIVLLSSYV